VAIVLGAVTAARADMGARFVPAATPPQQSSPETASNQVGASACLDSGLSDLLLPAGVAAADDPLRKPGRLPAEPASLSLVLAGLGSLGAWHIGRAAKTGHLGNVPDWFHADGPAQVGHTFIANPDCSATLEACSLEPPLGAHSLLHLLRCDPPLLQPQCILVTESPRGPPFLFC